MLPDCLELGEGRELASCSDEDLQRDNVDADDLFGNGVLDLDASVDLEEVELLLLNVLGRSDGEHSRTLQSDSTHYDELDGSG
jgi:hypothetical protein